MSVTYGRYCLWLRSNEQLHGLLHGMFLFFIILAFFLGGIIAIVLIQFYFSKQNFAVKENVSLIYWGVDVGFEF